MVNSRDASSTGVFANNVDKKLKAYYMVNSRDAINLPVNIFFKNDL